MNKRKTDNPCYLHDSLAPEKHLFFYHPDHLGCTSWVTDTGGNAVQHLHYLPMLKSCAFFPPWHSAEQTSLLCAHCLRRFGETFINQKTTTFAARYTFSGKEKDTETGYNYFGARYYNSNLSVWLSVDPMSDKYPTMSAYVYCANNPVKLVDPNGEEFDIDGYCYVPGQACPKDAEQSTQDKWNSMNNIYKTENGKKVIDEMNGEGVTYNVSSETKGNANGRYVSNRDGTGGTIYLNGNNSNTAILAHEMFHGYQDMKGQGGSSLFNEIEANLFSLSAGGCSFLFNATDNYDVEYSKELNKLTMSEEFNHSSFDFILDNFIDCAATNHKGTYDNYPKRRDNQTQNLIQEFYPIIHLSN